jgi:fructosamine-3-kinase
MDRSLLNLGVTLSEKIGGFFVDYRPQPSLLHGDLWSGNAAALPDGVPLIYDPAVYRGDRECDLAMAELFGGFPEAFYAAYREAWPLDPGYETRKTLYNLYHVLNHFNLFGASYLGQAKRMIERLLAELKG